MYRNLTAVLIAFFLAAVALPGLATASDATAGQVIFNANCSSCHGLSGKGDGPVGSALNPSPRDFTVGDFAFDPSGNGTKGEDDDLKQVIQNGAMKFGGSPLMAPWPTLSEAQVDDIIAFIRTLKGK